MNKIFREKKSQLVTFYHIRPYIRNVENALCTIRTVNQLEARGFLIKIEIAQEFFYCIMTNASTITQDMIDQQVVIDVGLNQTEWDPPFKRKWRVLKIKLDTNERYIKTFTNIGLDLTVVEIIIEEDKISFDDFLYNSNFTSKGRLIGYNVYIPQDNIKEKLELVPRIKLRSKPRNDEERYRLSKIPHNLDRKIKKYIGRIKDIKKYQIRHSAIADNGFMGSPLCFTDTFNVVGINYASETKVDKYAYLIEPAVKIIKVDVMERRLIGRYDEEQKKYFWNYGKYYIGQMKNGLPDGKGVKYYFNGKVQYDGTFTQGKLDGFGKFIYPNEHFYIGQYKNGLRQGKGKLYYPDGRLHYDGDWVNGIPIGYGKYIWENGEYYIGPWVNGFRQGKGYEYYPNGKLKYEGDYFNDKFEGYGKYIWEDDHYYIGQFENGCSHGRGIQYYRNGKVQYDGTFVNNHGQGYGLYIWEDEHYYIGQFKKSIRHGMGQVYYTNNVLKYDGDFIEDLKDGKGLYMNYDEDNKPCEYYIGEFEDGYKNGKGRIFNVNGVTTEEGKWKKNEPLLCCG